MEKSYKMQQISIYERLFLFVTGLDTKVKNIVKEIKVLMFFRSMAAGQKESWKL